MLEIIAQAVDTVASEISDIQPWASISATSAVIGLFVWMMTKQWPKMIERADAQQQAARDHFEKILDKMEENRKQSARDGHEAAKAIAGSLDRQSDAIENSARVVSELANVIKNHP